jgi:hypothetical protein
MKEDLWKSFAMKHRYDSSSRDDAARRERLRRVVDDIAYALYGGKLATAARVSRPHVGSANRAWLSAEFIPARQPRPRPTPQPSRPSARRGTPPRPSPTPQPSRPSARRGTPPRPSRPSRTSMDSQSNDEFFARHGGPAPRARSRSPPRIVLAQSAPARRVPMDSQSNDEFFARHS